MKKYLVGVGVVGMAAASLYLFSFYFHPTSSPQVLEPVSKFIDAVDHGRSDQAWSLLTTEVRATLSHPQFVAAGNDFALLIAVFSSSTNTKRTLSRKVAVPVEVNNFSGVPGAARFILLRDGGEWRIGNIVREP